MEGRFPYFSTASVSRYSYASSGSVNVCWSPSREVRRNIAGYASVKLIWLLCNWEQILENVFLFHETYAE